MPIPLLASEPTDLCCFSSRSPAEFITLSFVPCPFLACFFGSMPLPGKKYTKQGLINWKIFSKISTLNLPVKETVCFNSLHYFTVVPYSSIFKISLLNVKISLNQWMMLNFFFIHYYSLTCCQAIQYSTWFSVHLWHSSLKMADIDRVKLNV